MKVPRPLIIGGILAAGGFLGWVMNAYSDEAVDLLRAASGSPEPQVRQPADTREGKPLLIVIPDDSTAPPDVPAGGDTAQAASGDPGVTVSPDRPSRSAVEAVNAPTTAGVPEVAKTTEGDYVVVAYDDSIVLVGDNGRLTGNTGDAGEGGVVALDAQGSAFKTSVESARGGDLPQGSAATLATGGPGSSQPAGAVMVAGNGTMTAERPGGMDGGTGTYVPNAPPGAVSPLISTLVSATYGRQVDIAGFEDHSLSVRGQGQIVTYDDSNVFINRNGKINANTGDLDSAGLNAVDTLRSFVSAGPHCDDGCDDESIIQARAGVFDEGDVALDADGNPVWAPDVVPGAGETGDGGDEGNGDDENSDEEAEEEDSDASDPADTSREAADTTREAAGTGVEPTEYPSGDDFLVIGGDGYDDLGIRTDGADNIITYDDSNVVIGGTGGVNAQIGDADTGGAALMGTVDSVASGGNSR
jgi:hypothetical protein